MKKLSLLVLPLLILSTACGGTQNVSSSEEDTFVPEVVTNYAYFMNNYPRVIGTSPSGLEEKMENTLYLKVEIKAGELITKPADPEREDYEFRGWFKEKECVKEWNFATDKSDNTIFLYAKWGLVKGGEYVEPEYVYPEKIVTEYDFKVNGIFNTPIIADKVSLTSGMISRLERNKNDVQFAIDYERSIDTTFEASYDTQTKKITITPSKGDEVVVTVKDISMDLSIESENSGFEQKAQKYETVGTGYENYHIALAGSSSMENWSTSLLDMSPIVTFNHGIGGTTVEQWTNKLFQRLVLPYLPKAVVYYVGVNNIINGNQESGSVTGARLEALFDKTHQYLPNSQIFYVLINKLPGFANKQNDFDLANSAALEYEKNHDYLTCIDAGIGLLKEDGTPNAAYFLVDGLHMSKYGYVIWGAAVREAIENWLDSTK